MGVLYDCGETERVVSTARRHLSFLMQTMYKGETDSETSNRLVKLFLSTTSPIVVEMVIEEFERLLLESRKEREGVSPILPVLSEEECVLCREFIQIVQSN